MREVTVSSKVGSFAFEQRHSLEIEAVLGCCYPCSSLFDWRLVLNSDLGPPKAEKEQKGLQACRIFPFL